MGKHCGRDLFTADGGPVPPLLRKTILRVTCEKIGLENLLKDGIKGATALASSDNICEC